MISHGEQRRLRLTYWFGVRLTNVARGALWRRIRSALPPPLVLPKDAGVHLCGSRVNVQQLTTSTTKAHLLRVAAIAVTCLPLAHRYPPDPRLTYTSCEQPPS